MSLWDMVAQTGLYWFDPQNPYGQANQQASAQNQMHSQMVAQYNSQYCSRNLQSGYMPFQPAPIAATERKADCEGCGAPLKAYIHHCEYCRRAA